jgi:hypothetical protein
MRSGEVSGRGVNMVVVVDVAMRVERVKGGKA